MILLPPWGMASILTYWSLLFHICNVLKLKRDMMKLDEIGRSVLEPHSNSELSSTDSTSAIIEDVSEEESNNRGITPESSTGL